MQFLVGAPISVSSVAEVSPAVAGHSPRKGGHAGASRFDALRLLKALTLPKGAGRRIGFPKKETAVAVAQESESLAVNQKIRVRIPAVTPSQRVRCRNRRGGGLQTRSYPVRMRSAEAPQHNAERSLHVAGATIRARAPFRASVK